METTINQKHTIDTFYQAFSRFFERTGYYGIRSLLLLYMLKGVLKLQEQDAVTIYSWFVSTLLFSQILGAIIGDFLLNKKKTIVIGCSMQALGALSLCMPNSFGLFLGLGLVNLGGGLCTPNMIARFGKLYINKTNLIDSAFTQYYVAINLGAFLGGACIGFLSNRFGSSVGFISCSILMLLSLVFTIISKDSDYIESIRKSLPMNHRIAKIVIGIILVSLFWALYQISNLSMDDLQMQFEKNNFWNIPIVFWTAMNSVFMIPACIIMAILWSFFFSSSYFKLSIGFLLGALAFISILCTPLLDSDQQPLLYIFATLLLAIAEVHIGPIIYSIIIQYANPKYFSLIISLVFIPGRIFSYLIMLGGFFYANHVLAIQFSSAIMSLIGLSLLIYVLVNRKNESKTKELNRESN